MRNSEGYGGTADPADSAIDLSREKEHVVKGGTSSKVFQTATPNGPVEYASFGHGPVLLFLHGAGGGYDQAQDLANRYAPLGYRVVSVSRFGYMRIPIPHDASLAAQADAYAHVLNALGVPSVILVAVSAGAPSALEFALRHPGRCNGLVLVVPAVYRDASRAPSSLRPIERYLLARLFRFPLLIHVLCRLFARFVIKSVFGTPPTVVAAAASSDRLRVTAMVRGLSRVAQKDSGGLHLDAQFTIYPNMERLLCMRVPTLAISAADDLYLTRNSARDIARFVANTRLIIYPSGGHLLVGRERHMAEEIAAFVNEHASTSPTFGRYNVARAQQVRRHLNCLLNEQSEQRKRKT